MNWLRWFRRSPQREREIVLVSYTVGDRMLRDGSGWRLAPEEDRNGVAGWVLLERDLPEVARC